MIELFRSLFPRWNFYDEVSHELCLEVKPSGGSEWVPLPFEAKRTSASLLINPAVTLLHAQLSVLGDFVSDLSRVSESDGRVDSAVVQSLTSFALVNALVRERLRAFEPIGMAIQFRILARHPQGDSVIYVSDVLMERG